MGDCASLALEPAAVDDGMATVLSCPSMVIEVSIFITMGARLRSSSTSSSSNMGVLRLLVVVVLRAYGGGGAGSEDCLWRLARTSASLWLWCLRESDGGSILAIV